MFRGKPALIKDTHKLAEGEAKVVDIGDPFSGGAQVVFGRINGEIHALDTLCPHEKGRIVGGPLHDGRYVLCPLHNYFFDIKTGDCKGDLCKGAKRYKVREENGDCEIWV